MRKASEEAYKDLQHLASYKHILETAPASAQQKFIATILALELCNKKQEVTDLLPLLNSYKGSFSHLILNLKYCTYCMEKDKSKTYSIFTILKLLSKWVDIHQGLKKKKDIRIYDAVVDGLQLGIASYQEFIVYLNFIANDLITLIKDGSEQSKKKYPDLSKHPHLEAADLLKFMNVALPKVLTNMIVPRNFFPPTLLKSTQQNIDLLYSNQIVENIAQNKPHYNSLLRTILKCLLSMDLQPSQVKQVVLLAFKYYYLYHFDKNYSSSQIIIQALKKMNSAVRFAIVDEISLFLIVIKKLGKELFINYLSEKFGWISDTIKNNTVVGINKLTFKPFFSQPFNNSLKIKVDAGKTQHFFVEIYDRFSLLYFSIRCLEYDISIRFYFLGKFNMPEGLEEKKLLINTEKKQGPFEGSLQAIQQGIYMFQFDNSYAWMKAKTILFDLSINVPLQLRQHSKNQIKPLIFERYENLNCVPYENVLGWVDEKQIRFNSTSANVCCTTEANFKIYNVKVVKNTGQAYEYQTQIKSRLMRKLKDLEKDPNLFWLIEGYRVQGVADVQRWLEGQFEPGKLHTYREETAQVEGKSDENQIIRKQEQSFRQQQNERLKKQKISEQVREEKIQKNNDKDEQKLEQGKVNIEQKKTEQKEEQEKMAQNQEKEEKEQVEGKQKKQVEIKEAGQESGQGQVKEVEKSLTDQTLQAQQE